MTFDASDVTWTAVANDLSQAELTYIFPGKRIWWKPWRRRAIALTTAPGQEGPLRVSWDESGHIRVAGEGDD